MRNLKLLKIELLAVLLLLPVMSLASSKDDNGYKWKTWKTRRSMAGFNGHGGCFLVFQSFQSDDLDFIAEGMGLDPLPGKLVGFGGIGMGHVGDGWRIGGFGFGSRAKTSGIVTGDDGQTINRELDVMYGGGGLVLEFAPWMVKRVNFGLGTWLGFAGYCVKLHQDSGTYGWDDLYEQYFNEYADQERENMNTEVCQGYLILRPYVTTRVHIIDWLALEGSIGVNFDSSFDSKWRFEEDKISGDGPEIDLLEPFFRIGVVFGG